jgi:plastocyanin
MRSRHRAFSPHRPGPRAPSPRPRRRRIGAVATVTLVLGVLGAASVAAAVPAGAKSTPPVTLEGKVNNKGVGTVSNGKVEIEQDNFYFKKTFIKGTAGTVTVKLENEGNTEHSFTIDDQNIDEVVQPGKKKTVTLTLTDGQPVNFYCKFHRSSGMQGAFFTTAGTTNSTR